MRKDWVLTKEVFEAFLGWLSPDREEAAAEYEKIRRKLFAFFEIKGCETSEILTDETINRVSDRLVRAQNTGEIFPRQFLYGTARVVYLESKNNPPDVSLEDEPNAARAADAEKNYFSRDERECMNLCFEQLTEKNRDLIVSYFQISGKNKLARREKLARKYRESVEALRVQASRVRQKLQKCQKNCLNGKK